MSWAWGLKEVFAMEFENFLGQFPSSLEENSKDVYRESYGSRSSIGIFFVGGVLLELNEDR